MNKGFTLIELLVVVLIIGILSSLALPQYKKAVEKTRASEAWSMLASIYKVLEIKNMAEGTSGQCYNFDELDLSFVNESGTEATTLYTTPNFYYSMTDGEPFDIEGCIVEAQSRKSSYGSYYLSMNKGKKTCWGMDVPECSFLVGNGTASNKACKALNNCYVEK